MKYIKNLLKKLNINKKLFSMGVGILVVTIIANTSTNTTFAVAQDTCPDGNGWVKINSDDLSSYPVANASAYCFKAGSDNSQGCTGGLFDAIPNGGFGTNGYCGLSHWSYYDPGTPTPTPTATPTGTPTSTPTPTPTVTPTATPTSTPTSTPTATPTSTPTPTPEVECEGNVCIIVDCEGEGECEIVFGSPTPTPTPTSTPTNTPTATPTNSPSNTPQPTPTPAPKDAGEVDYVNSENNGIGGGGQVLGASTFAATGLSGDFVNSMMFTLGMGFIATSVFKKENN